MSEPTSPEGAAYLAVRPLLATDLGFRLDPAATSTATRGSSPLTLVHGRQSQNTFATHKLLVIGLANGSNGAGPYATVSALTVAGTRAYV